ncbi:hypothetical protein [Modestobacter versicolor]|nr:hypothetical protein [Modestobacter versicolor]PZA19613.1 hypothetical protein DMO24_19815 [Modestobacter versicolor]
MLVWPVVAVLGFVVLAALVVALAQSSTARYEFERNQVQGQRQQAAVPAAAEPVLVGAATVARPVAGGGAAVEEIAPELLGAAAHPAGKRVAEPLTPPAWWLVQEDASGAIERVVDGPFHDRMEADWAALAGGSAEAGRPVYGVLRLDGRLVRRQSPQEQAWLAELGEQLDRLPEDWDGPLADEDELVTLVVEVAAALVEAGLPLHDCAGDGVSGGVCLTPEPSRGGVLVSWHQHDRMSREQVRGAETDAAVQQTMNGAITDCLRQLGFDAESLGESGCSLVTAAERWW